MGTYFPLDKVKNALNKDGEFKLVARFWTVDIRFKVEDEFYFMVIRDGVVEDFYHGTTVGRIYHQRRRTLTGLDKMMELPPQPFITTGSPPHFITNLNWEDLQSAYAYYYALKRIHASMAQCVNTTKFAA